METLVVILSVSFIASSFFLAKKSKNNPAAIFYIFTAMSMMCQVFLTTMWIFFGNPENILGSWISNGVLIIVAFAYFVIGIRSMRKVEVEIEIIPQMERTDIFGFEAEVVIRSEVFENP